MIFLFGTGSKVVGTELLPNVACVHCGNTNTLICTVYSRYFSIFWIPVFPIGKTSATVCRHCKQALSTQEMPAAYQAPARAIESQSRTPLSSFALLLIVGVMLVLFAGLVAYTKYFGPIKPSATTTAPATAAFFNSILPAC